MEPEIKKGDILVVDRSIKLESGKIAALYFNGEAICKQYLKTSAGIILRSINTKYKDIIVTENDELELFGVVIGITRDV